MKAKTKPSNARRIVITVPAGVLKDVDWLAHLEEMNRSQLIVEAVRRFLLPHLEQRREILKSFAQAKNDKTFGPFDTAEEMIASLKANLRKRSKITKAIPESTDRFKTGRYQP